MYTILCGTILDDNPYINCSVHAAAGRQRYKDYYVRGYSCSISINALLIPPELPPMASQYLTILFCNVS